MGRTKKAEALSYYETCELFEAAKEKLEQAELTIGEVKAILDRAGQTVKRAKDKKDRTLQAEAVRVQLRAKRRIGQMVFGSVD